MMLFSRSLVLLSILLCIGKYVASDQYVCEATEVFAEDIFAAAMQGEAFVMNGFVSEGDLYDVINECTVDNRTNTTNKEIKWFSLQTELIEPRSIYFVETDRYTWLSVYSGHCESPQCYKHDESCPNDDDDRETWVEIPATGATYFFGVSQCEPLIADAFQISFRVKTSSASTTWPWYYSLSYESVPLPFYEDWSYSSQTIDDSSDSDFLGILLTFLVILALFTIFILCTAICAGFGFRIVKEKLFQKKKDLDTKYCPLHPMDTDNA